MHGQNVISLCLAMMKKQYGKTSVAYPLFTTVIFLSALVQNRRGSIAIACCQSVVADSDNGDWHLIVKFLHDFYQNVSFSVA